MLAGPNGAGKTTFYRKFLSELSLPFLNADLLAAEMEIDSFEAARIIDASRDRMIEDGLGFVTETVFSDRLGAKLGMLRKALEAGYAVTLLYIGIASPELSERRVDQRVARGGHDVPRDRLTSRYERSIENLREAVVFVPTVQLFDNSLVEEPYQHIATFDHGALAWRAAGALPAWCRGLVRGKPTKG
jgi:predicted ABC-type ATPase